MFIHSCLYLLSHCGLILAQRVEISVCELISIPKRKRKMQVGNNLLNLPQNLCMQGKSHHVYKVMCVL